MATSLGTRLLAAVLPPFFLMVLLFITTARPLMFLLGVIIGSVFLASWFSLSSRKLLRVKVRRNVAAFCSRRGFKPFPAILGLCAKADMWLRNLGDVIRLLDSDPDIATAALKRLPEQERLNRALWKEMVDLKRENRRLKHENKQVPVYTRKLEAVVNATSLWQLEREIELDELNAHRAEVDASRYQIAVLTAQRDQALTRANAAVTERNTLANQKESWAFKQRAMVAAHEDVLAEREEMRKTIEILKRDNEILVEENMALKEANEDYVQQVQVLQGQLLTARLATVEADVKVEEVEGTLQTAYRELEEERKSKVHVQETFDAEVAALVAKAECELAASKAKLQESEKKLAERDEVIAQRDSRIVALQSALTTYDGRTESNQESQQQRTPPTSPRASVAASKSKAISTQRRTSVVGPGTSKALPSPHSRALRNSVASPDKSPSFRRGSHNSRIPSGSV